MNLVYVFYENMSTKKLIFFIILIILLILLATTAKIPTVVLKKLTVILQ